MPERIVYWRALADFSKVRSEAAKTKASIKELNDETKDLDASNNELGKSEEAVAQKTTRSGNAASSAAQKVAAARDKATQATEDSTKALNENTKSENQSRLSSAATAKAKAAEARAAQDVVNATENVKAAREAEQRASNRTEAAEAELQRTRESNEATSRQIVAAEKQLAAVRDAETRATEKTRQANARLDSARQRQAQVAAENAYAEAKAATAYEDAEKRKAKAAEDAQARQAAATERQDRIDARAENARQTRAEAAASRDARRAQQAEARDAAYERTATARNNRLLNEYDRLVAAREAANNTPNRPSPTRSFSDLDSAKVNSAQNLVNNSDSNTRSSAQTTAANALLRAEEQLKAARDAEASSYARLNEAESRLAAARATSATISRQETAAEADVAEARAKGEGISREALDADTRLINVRRDLQKALHEEEVAENAAHRARLGVAEAGDRVERSGRRLISTTESVERAFAGGGGGGNFFRNALNGLFDGFEKVDDGASKAIGKLRGLRWPALAGGAYLFAEALSTVVGGLFEIASAVAPAIGGLAAILPVVYALGGALLSVKAAFSGIGGALKAYSAQQMKASTVGAKAAKTESDNADQIKNAQQNLAEARENVTTVYVAGQKSVTDASDAIVSATQNETDAQQQLNQARLDAKKNIEDLKNATIDAALAERAATLDLADAKANLQHVLDDPNSSRADRERAQLQVDQSAQSAKEATQSSSQASSDSQSAVAAGVEGNSNVIAAKKQLQDANKAVIKSEEDYRDALASASRDNAKAIRSVTTAERALSKAQRQNTADMASGGAAADTYQQKLDALPPAAQKFVAKLISMKHYWNDLRATAAANLFPGLTRALDQLPKLFPVIRSGVASISREVGNLGDEFAHMITTPRWISAFKKLNQASTPILRTIGHAVMNIVDALRAVAVAAIPMTEKLARGFESWTKGIDDAADAAQKNGNLGKFFEHSYQVIHQLGQILKNIGTGFFNMGKAATDSGQSMLDSMQKLTKRWADWTGSIQGQNELAKYFADVRENMKYIDHLIWVVTKGFLGMGDNKNFKPILDALGAIGTALKNAFGGQGNNVSSAFISLLYTIAKVISTIAKNSDGLSVFIGTLNTMLTLFNGFLKIPGVGPAIGVIFAALAAFKALRLLGVISMVRGLGNALAWFKKSAKGTGAAAAEAEGALAGTQAAASGSAAVGTATVAGGAAAASSSGRASTVAAGAAAAGSAVPGRRALSDGSERAANGKLYATTRPKVMPEKKPSILSRLGKGLGGLIGIGGKGAAGAAEGEVSAGSKGGPWGLLAAAIAAALTLAYVKVKWFHDGVNRAFADIGKVLKSVWEGFLKPLFMFFVSSMRDLGNAFKNLWKAFSPIVSLFKPLFSLLQPLLPVLKYIGIALGIVAGAALLLLTPFGQITLAIVALTAIFGVLAKVIAWAINNIIVPVINFMVAVFKVQFAVIGAILGVLVKVVSTIFKAIVGIFRWAAKIIFAVVSVAFKVIAAIILAPIYGLIKLFQWIWSKIGDDVKAGLNKIKGWLKTAWDAIKLVANVAWQAIKNVIVNPIKDAFGAVRSAWNAVYGWLKSQFNTAKGVFSGLWKGITGAITSAFGAVEGALSAVWNKVKSVFAGAVNFVTQKILNPLIGAVNAVITTFGIGAIGKIGKIEVDTSSGGGSPSAATGGVKNRAFKDGGVNTTSSHNIGSMVPGYTPGRDPHEFVSSTGYRIKLSGGEGILTPETTRALGGKSGIDALNATYSPRLRNRGSFKSAQRRMGMESHADGGLLGSDNDREGFTRWQLWRMKRKDDNEGGLLDKIGNIGGKLTGLLRRGAGAVIEGGFKAVEAPIRELTKLIPMPLLQKVMNGLFDKVNRGVYNTIAGKNPNAKNSLTAKNNDAKYTGVITGDQARNDVMISGLTLTNSVRNANPLKSAYANSVASQYPSYLSDLRTIIGAESGWNASAINRTDSNAKAGHPSQGLMQTIPTTYETYKNPNMDRGILDAISNVTAGINYAKSRYGGIGSVPGVEAVKAGKPYVGYNSGGVVQSFHTGGLVTTGKGRAKKTRQYADGSVPGLTRKSSNGAISALLAQAGITFPTNGNSRWTSKLSSVFRSRLQGVDRGHDVTRVNNAPAVESRIPGDSATTKALMNWVDKHDPKTYAKLWSTEPFDINRIWENSYHRNPLMPILSYDGNPKIWQQYRAQKDAAYWQNLTDNDNKKPSKGKSTKKVKTSHQGFANLESVKKFIHQADKKPYVFGAVGPDAYDCSGLTGEVWARLTGHPSYHRYFSTMNEGSTKYFQPGEGDGTYVVGYSNNAREEHTAGRLDGLKFEARGTAEGIIVGSQARNPESFDHVRHLPAHTIKGISTVQSNAVKKMTVADEKKKHPRAVRALAKQDKQWHDSIRMLASATATEKSRVAQLRKTLNVAGAGNNDGLYSSDMVAPMDHAAAHALGINHPADWPHPWTGAQVSAAESALADSDRSNALNKEWFADLGTLATWGYEDLVNYLLGKGVADGLSIARSAVKDKKTAKQLNASIHAGLVTGGVNGDDQTSILKIIAKLGSGTAARPYGLRDVAADLNVADYVPVNLFGEMTAQLKKLPASLTKRFISDVDHFRKGTFYASTGGMVPGDRGTPNVDTVPAMLVPGEGILSRKAMQIVGESGLNALNNGVTPQLRANGGMILSPTFNQMGVNSSAMRTSSARSTLVSNSENRGPSTVNLNTTINNPTGESSVYSQNKMLQKNAAVGTVAKVAGVNG